ncbi:MAG: outer membrane beta-barrel protein [Bacteroidota bacterium]
MDDNREIDELFRTELESVEMEPSENVWNQLEAELERKQSLIYKKSATRFKLLSLGLALLLLSFLAFNYLMPTRESGKGENKALNVKVEEKLADLVSEKQESSVKSSIKSEQIVKNDVTKINNSRYNSVPSTLKGSNGAHFSNIGNANINPSIENTESSLAITNGKSNKSKKEENLINSNQAINDVASTELVHPIDSSISPTNDLVKAVDNPITNDNVVLADTIKPKEALYVKEDSTKNHETKDSIAIDKKKFLSRFSIAAYYSPDYKSSFLKNNVANSNESVEYKNREKSEFSFTTGININYDLNDHWRIGGGVNYSKMVYSMNYSTIYVKYGFDNMLHYQYPTSCGIIEIPNTKNRVLHDGDSVNVFISCAQTLKFIDIPLAVQYQFGTGNLFWHFNAGVSINYMAQEKVLVNVGTREFTIVNNIDGLQKFSCGLMLGGGMEYRFCHQFSLLLDPTFRASITSLTQNTEVNCYPYSFGLNTGILYHF